MRVLAVHADSLAFEAVQPAIEGDAATPDDDPTDAAATAGECGECVVGFVAVERGDRADKDAVAADAAAELDAVADRLGAERIALVPREHLVDEPAEAAAAAAALEALAEGLAPEREILRAPVGWRLAVEIERKGHPFAEQAIRVVPRRRDGDETPQSGDEPAIEALSNLGLATPDPRTDGDAVRWLPRGQFLRGALREYAEGLLEDLDATAVSTPALGVHTTADRREGVAPTGPILGPADSHQLLRPGVHGGLYSLLADADLDEAPVRRRETARWSADSAANVPPAAFGRRVRPEYHAALSDEAAAIDEFERLARVAADAAATLGADGTLVLRLAEDVRDDRPAFADRVAAALAGEVSVEAPPDEERYWAARLAFVASDGAGGEYTLGSVELDAATPTRFGIAGEDRAGPVLVHAAPIGDVEGAITALSTRAASSERTGLPTWLAPTQVRLMPIDDRHVEHCDDAAAELRAAGVRADVDARAATVGERLDRGDRERVPYVAVVGDRELDGAALSVRVLETGREERLSVDDLRERVLSAREERSVPSGAPSKRVSRGPSDSGS